MSRAALQNVFRLKGGFCLPIVSCSGVAKILPTQQLPFAPVQEPVKQTVIISLPSARSVGLVYSVPKITPVNYHLSTPLPLPEAFNSIFSNTWLNFDFDIDLPEENEKVVPPSIQPNKEISEPGADKQPAVQCKMYQGRNVKRLRRVRMRRHRYVKWLKRMRFKLRKIRFEREKKKGKVFQDQLDGVTKSAESFNPENFIKNEVELGRKGDYHYDVQSDLKRFLTMSSDDKSENKI